MHDDLSRIVMSEEHHKLGMMRAEHLWHVGSMQVNIVFGRGILLEDRVSRAIKVDREEGGNMPSTPTCLDLHVSRSRERCEPELDA